jgi:anaerobic carbon-monoxide dehydrogenase catalytic subunit
MSTLQLKPEDRAMDAASIEMIQKAQDECLDTCFSRADQQKTPCGFGKGGICCRICYMGPCRITAKSPLGVCGADADTIVARNYLREVASGTAAHSDHGRHLVLLFKKVAGENGGSYALRDKRALLNAARDYAIETSGRTPQAIAVELADKFLEEFKAQETPLATLQLAPEKRRAVWKQHKIEPSGIDSMVVESLHRSTMGVDHD